MPALALGVLATVLALTAAFARRPRRNMPAPPATHRLAAPAHALHGAAGLLAAAVLADSAVEHYRGQFHNPGMLAPLLMAAAMLRSAWRRPGPSAVRSYAGAVATGAAGIGFHLYDVRRRPGKFSWQNLFYGAPLGAPAALVLAGLFGLAGQRLEQQTGPAAPRLLGMPAGRVLCGLGAGALVATSAEAALFHFRGAFHDPRMWLPLSAPPVAAALLAQAALASAPPRRWTRLLLACTGALGLAGVGFHVRGVARQMGGWRNWRQNLLSGPPLSAPPSFLALAMAGHAALAPSVWRAT